jgi:hypothetical protein
VSIEVGQKQRRFAAGAGIRNFAAIIGMALAIAGCSSEERPAQTTEQLLEARDDAAQAMLAEQSVMMSRMIARAKRQYDNYAAHRRQTPPVVDVLIISGGGDWGAFGAGFLKGWTSVPADQPLAMPDFSVVTGVSTGALIAPFAFVEDAESINRIDHLYRNPDPDWVEWRGLLYFLPSHISFAEVPGLERALKENVTLEAIKKIADRGADGRILVVNTTDLDDGSPRVFDLVDEANRAVRTGDADRIREVMLASAGIPGAFPFRIIDGVMYVDGGVAGNIIYGGRIAEQDSFPAQWQATYPDLPIPKTRYWVIFNNKFRPTPVVTEPNWPAVVQRALETGTRLSTITAFRHLLAMAEISRLKRHADVEVRIVAIPNDWVPPKEGTFVKETMNNLADLGVKMGSDPTSWMTSLP